MVTPPKYLSESRVLVVGRDNIYLRPDADKDIFDRSVVDPEAVTSQVQLILSRDLASEVIDKLKLGERREFDPALGGVSLVKRVLGIFGFIKNPMSMTPQERVLEAYYDRLSVYAVDKSRVIVIDFLSENPELAARVANAVADAYLERQQAAKQEQARSAGQWLSGEIESMRKKVAEAEAKVEAFRAKSNLLVGPNNTTLSAQQLGDLNAQLAAARAQKADAEARARLIRDMLQSGEPIESSDILNSELIRRLSEQRVTLRAQLAEQSSSLLDNHPRIKELKAQIADLDKQIRKEAEIMARSLENDAKLADARVEAQLADLRPAQGPGGDHQRAGRPIARARARSQVAARSVGIVSGQIPRGERPRHHQFGAARCADDFARHGVERAGLPEKTADGADREPGDAGADFRHGLDPRAVGGPGACGDANAGPRRG